VQKINDYRIIAQKANDYYTIVLTNQYFQELPNWCTRSFRYVIDNWIKAHCEMS
jgi:kinesin family protein 4/21/27